jgi:hypothetical protein
MTDTQDSTDTRDSETLVDGHSESAADNRIVTVYDFYAFAPKHQCIHIPTGDLWPYPSVDERIPTSEGSPKASRWIAQNRSVDQITWAPGGPEVINDWYVIKGGWKHKPGARCFNRYRPPVIFDNIDNIDNIEKLQQMPMAELEQLVIPWRALGRFLWPDEVEEITDYLAFKVQYPGMKINHLLLLAGAQRIGKDLWLVPVRHAVGPWNWGETSPKAIMGTFTSHLECVMLRISESRDRENIDGHDFYERLKPIAATPPETHPVNEKHWPVYQVPNVNGTIVTSNHETGSIIPERGDERIFATWSKRTRADFLKCFGCTAEQFFVNYGYWYEHGSLPGWRNAPHTGIEYVAAYLARRDVSKFDPYKPPRKTPAYWNLFSSNVPPEAAALADLLDDMGKPIAVTLDQVKHMASHGFGGVAGRLNLSLN